jgi:hypothetical protein
VVSFDVLLRPRVAQYRTVDIVQIVASSAVVGMGLGMAIMMRARRRTAASVVDIQLTLDGILADTTPAPSGASPLTDVQLRPDACGRSDVVAEQREAGGCWQAVPGRPRRRQ